MPHFDDLLSGAYDAHRASQLSGVPATTLHRWATEGLVVPSVSPQRVRLWSYADLITLRLVAWLRHEKPESPHDGARVWPPSPKNEVRAALSELARRGIGLFSEDEGQARRCPLMVDATGRIIIDTGRDRVTVRGQPLLPHETVTDILRAFAPGRIGEREAPDLASPRPHLRIVPGKVSGEAHVAGTRVTTPTLAALGARGMSVATICELYPDLNRLAVEEAIDLESKLAAA